MEQRNDDSHPPPENSATRSLLVARLKAEIAELKEMLRAQELQQTILSQVAECITVTDVEGRIIFVNEAVAKLLGRSRRELIGRSVEVYGENPERGPRQREIIETTLRDGQWRGEVVNRDRHGREFVLESHTYLIRDAAGEPAALCGIGRDITERKRTEEALRDREQSLRSIFRAAPIGIGLVVERIFTQVNDRLCEMLGYGRGELIGQDARMVYPSAEEYRRVGQEKYAEIRETGTGVIETQFRRKDGTLLDVLLSSTPLDPADLSAGVTFTALDITDRKRADETLRENETRYHELFSHMGSGVAVYEAVGEGEDFIFKDINPAGAEMGRMPREAHIGRSVREVYPGVVEMGLFDVLKRVWRTGNPEQFPISEYRDERLTLWAENYVFKLPSGLIVVVYDDVTELKRAQETLKESEARFRQLADLLPETIYEADADGVLTYTNKSGFRQFGYDESDLDGARTCLDMVVPEERESARFVIRRLLSGQETGLAQYTALRKDGSTFPVLIRSTPVVRNGEVAGFRGIIIDITERADAEARLRESEQRLRMLMDNLPGMVYRCPNVPDWPSEFVSEGSLELTGYAPEELTGPDRVPYADLIHPEDRDMVWDTIQRALRKGEPFIVEYRIRRKNGEERWVAERGRRIGTDDTGTAILEGLVTDITDRRRAEEAVRESERFLNFAVEQNPIPVIIAAAPDARIMYINREAEKLLAKPTDPHEITLDRHREFWPTFHPDGTPYRIEDLPLTRAIRRGDITVDEQIIVRLPDGDHWISASAAPLRDADGGVIAGIVAFPKITERKRAEEALRESERFLRSTLDALTAHVAILDESGKILAVNRAWREFGQANDLAPGTADPGTNYLEVCARADGDETEMAANFADGIREVLSGKRDTFELEYPCHSPDEQRWFYGRVTRFPGDGPLRVVVAHENVTERKLADTKLRNSERILNETGRMARIGGWEHDLVTRKAVWTGALHDIIGIPHDEAPPGPDEHLEYYPPEHRRVLAQAYDRAIREGTPFDLELQVNTTDGSVLWCRAYGEPVFDGDRCVKIRGTFQDIAERKRAESELAEKERYYRGLIYSLHEDIVVLDREYRIADANNSYIETTGLTTEEVIGRHCYEVSHGYNAPCPEHGETCRLHEVFQSGRPANCLHTHCRKDGTPVYADILLSPLKDAEGRVTHVVEAIRDVTDIMQAREAAETARSRLSLALASGNVGIWDWDLGTNEVYFCPEWKRQLGYADNELPNDYEEWAKRLHPEDRAATLQSLEDYLEGRADEYAPEFRLSHRDGSWRWIAARAEMQRDKSGKPVRLIGTHVDVTDRRALEEQLRQSQKIEAIGRLAGGVAHDFNNVLTGIKGYVALTLNELEPGSRMHRDLSEVEALSERAANLTRQLLAFSRRQPLEPVVLNVNDLIRDHVGLLERLLGEHIEIRFLPAEDLGSVKADPNQIGQVIMNLAVNARDAMRGGGALTIETANVTLDEDYAARHADAAPGPHVMIAVSDTGVGMDEETLEHLFEPFYTTKAMGEGTGLGLAMVHGIVKQHDGNIRVYSEPGEGTTFKIYLPRVQTESPAEMTREKAATGGGETILVVEDEESVRNIIRRNLESLGYVILCAASPDEAEALAAEREAAIDLLFTDVVLPGRNGRDLYNDLAAKRPGLKVLYMSGYTDSAIVKKGMIEEGVAFLQKPFDSKSLAAAVRRALDRE